MITALPSARPCRGQSCRSQQTERHLQSLRLPPGRRRRTPQHSQSPTATALSSRVHVCVNVLCVVFFVFFFFPLRVFVLSAYFQPHVLSRSQTVILRAKKPPKPHFVAVFSPLACLFVRLFSGKQGCEVARFTDQFSRTLLHQLFSLLLWRFPQPDSSHHRHHGVCVCVCVRG